MCVVTHVIAATLPYVGMTDDLLQQLRGNVPNTMLADLKDSLKTGRSLDIKDSSGATAVSLHVRLMQLYVLSMPTFVLDIQTVY